jgi:hypothetical protein
MVRGISFTAVGNLNLRKWLKILILVICLGLSILLTLFNYAQDGRLQHAGLLTTVLLLMLFCLFATGIVEVPRGVNIPFFTVWPRLSYSVKAALSFLLIFLWTPIAMQLTPDTPLGVAVLLGPDAIFVLAALVYLSNGLS